MPYPFELAFTGLCVFTTEGGLAKPTQLNVVLVDHPTAATPGDEHIPYFTCSARNLTKPPGRSFEILPGPDGEILVRHRLEGNERVTVSFQNGFPKHLVPNWKTTTIGETPASTSEAALLDWVTSIEKIFPAIKDTPSGAPYGGLDVRHSPIVTLTQGEIRAAALARHPLEHNFLSWEFLLNGTGTYDPKAAQSLAGRIIVKVYVNQGPVKIKAEKAGWELHLVTAVVDGVVEPFIRASVTSLPMHEPQNVGYLKHFGHLSHLIPSSLTPGPPHFPKSKPLDGGSSSNDTFCPPPWRTK